jgi:N12 class adenine-specific DNA methylase
MDYLNKVIHNAKEFIDWDFKDWDRMEKIEKIFPDEFYYIDDWGNIHSYGDIKKYIYYSIELRKNYNKDAKRRQ